MLVTGGIVYVGTRAFAQIHVQAKALAVIAPLALLVALMGLLEPAGDERRATLGLPPAPRHRHHRPDRCRPLHPDRPARRADRLRRAPARPRAARRPRRRQAGRLPRRRPLRRLLPAQDARPGPRRLRPRGDRRPPGEDLAAGPRRRLRLAGLGPARQVRLRDHHQRRLQLDRRRRNFQPVARAGDYVLWQRRGDTPRSRVLAPRGRQPRRDPPLPARQAGTPGARPWSSQSRRSPSYTDWSQPPPPGAQVAGQERGWQAPGTAHDPDRTHRGRRLQALAPVPLAGATDRPLRRRAGRRAAGVARRHVPERRRSRRLLAGGRGQRRHGRRARGDRPGCRPGRPRRDARRPAPGVAGRR